MNINNILSNRLKFVWICSISFLLIISSCAKKGGCKDQTALNYDSGADVEDGSCKFGKVLFYTTKSRYFSSLDKRPLPAVFVNNTLIDSLPDARSIVPVNCDTENTVEYDLTSLDPVEWRVIAITYDWDTVITSGTVQSNGRFCFPVGVN